MLKILIWVSALLLVPNAAFSIEACAAAFSDTKSATTQTLPVYEGRPIRLRDFMLRHRAANQLWSKWNNWYQGTAFYRPDPREGRQSVSVWPGTKYTRDQIEFLSRENESNRGDLRSFNKLFPIERAALQLYGEDAAQWYQGASRFSTAANDQLWKKAVVEPLHWFILPLASALKKLPKFSGVAFSGVPMRGSSVDELLNSYKEGQPYVNPGFISASQKLSTEYTSKSEIMLQIAGRSGVNIKAFSTFSHEDEVLFPPGCKFLVKSVTRKYFSDLQLGLPIGEKWVVELVELQD